MNLIYVFTIFLGAAASMSANGEPQQKSFEAAILNQSTSPLFVKIQVGGSTGTLSTNCVTANLLLGAIHREHGLPFTAAGTASASRLATTAPNATFRFGNPAALANLPDAPTPDELEAAAQQAAKVPPGSVVTSLRDGDLSALYIGRPRREQLMAALACALIDLGYKPRQADLTGTLYVDR